MTHYPLSPLRRGLERLLARRSGRRHFRHFDVLRRSQYDAPEVIIARQLVMLRSILHHAYATVPHYRDAFAVAGLSPDDIRSPADLALLPVLTKSDIRAHGERLRSESYADADVSVKKTSGSTGVPLRVVCDTAAMDFKAGCTMRADEWSGWRRGQPVAKVWGNPEYVRQGVKGRLRNWVIDRAVYLDTLKVTEATLADFARKLGRHKPALIFGHAHSIYLFAQYCERAGASVRPRGVIATAMPLHRWQRDTIERVFGCKATDRYGCEEVSLIACECEEHNGLHFNADGLLAEVVPLPGSPPGSRTGHLLLTDLVNRAMPLIRYQVGDVVTLSDRQCPCGRGLPLIESVQGREADYVVTPAGHYISGISLTENFAMKVPHVAQLQIVQETMTRVVFRIVRAAGFDEGCAAAVRSLAAELFGPGVQFDVEYADHIPQEASGKYRFCVSKVAKAGPAVAA